MVFANVWHDQLGHVKLHRITAVEREEKKKMDKREKREKDDEEERNKLSYNFVKYTLGLKHQVNIFISIHIYVKIIIILLYILFIGLEAER